jgi:Fe-S-cluster containining protein
MPRPDPLCEDVLGLLCEAEMRAVAFRRTAGVACPAGCDACCREDRPEDSVLACLPAARWALGQGWEARLAGAVPEEPCLFWEPGPAGGCGIYPLRPLICRLFGYAGVRDKHGRPAWRPCRRMVGVPAPAPEPPLFADEARRIEARYPPLGDRRLPLNLALREAAAWLALRGPRRVRG